MKVAYISSAAFSDVDFSLLNHLQQCDSIDYYLHIYPSGLKGATIDLNATYKQSGVFSCSIYPELSTLSNKLKNTSIYVCNSSNDRVFSVERFRASLQLFRHIRKNNYDIIHYTWFPNFSLLWLYFFRDKLVFTIHDPLPHSSLKSKTQLLYRRIAMLLGKHFILLNETQRTEFIKYYNINLKRQHIYSSRLGPYDYLTLYQKEPHITKADKYILFFGKIFSYKGLKYLLPAMRVVHRLHPNIKLIIAGSGTFDFDITEYTTEPYITILNRFIPESELVQLIRGALFVVAPYTDATQSGVVMTAYAFDKPCIVTNVGALPSVVKHMKTGLVIPASNTEAIADAITLLLSQEDLLTIFSQNIHKEFNTGKMSWNSIAMDMHKTYEEILNSYHFTPKHLQ